MWAGPRTLWLFCLFLVRAGLRLGGYVAKLELQGHRLQSKEPTKKGVRDDLCDKMMSMVNDKETYMGKKNNRGKPSSLQHQLRIHM